MQPAPIALVDAVPQWVWDAVNAYHDLLLQFGTFALALGVIYVIGRTFVVPSIVRVVRIRNPNDPTIEDAVELYGRVVVFVFSLAIATAAGGFQSAFQGSAIVFAAATLAVGVAGQDVIGNLVSGAFLVADPDFQVGDYIEWDASAGTVESIDFRVTRVRTADGAIVAVPNAELTRNSIRNPYNRGRARLQVAFGVRHADVGHAISLAREAAAAENRIVDDPEPSVLATEFGSTSVDLVARFWVHDPQRTRLLDVKDAYIRRLNDALLDADIAVNPPIQNELSGDVVVFDSAGDAGVSDGSLDDDASASSDGER